MARPRKPTALHVLSGAIDKNPARFRDRAHAPTDDRELGPPPPGWVPSKVVCWEEIARLAPWLRFGDRLAVEVAADLLHVFRVVGSNGMQGSHLGRLETMLGRLGLTPADRSRVGLGASSKPNAFERFRKSGA